MNATALFVELLVVGIGTATWLALFLAAILGYRFDTMILTDNQALVGTFIAVVYVLGIVMDRLFHGFFVATIEAGVRKKLFDKAKIKRVMDIVPNMDAGNLPMEMDKFIRSHSSALAGKIDYNRSRLRICRAWVLHFLLIGISFYSWNRSTHIFQPATTAWLLGIDALFLILTMVTTRLLAEDYQRDLLESFEIVTTPDILVGGKK